ncbi:MAG: serine hydrolase [Candidatus Nanopelagicales bacterium]
MPTHSTHHLPVPTWRRVTGAFVAAATVLAIPATAAVAAPPPSPTASPTAQVNEGSAVTLPNMRAWTWIVADADSGEVLTGRDWHWKLPPASTMKTLTALTLVDRLQLDSQYRAQKQDVEAEGSKVGLKAGSSYAVSDLFNGMLMPSGNDAATAVANAYGGMESTTEAMNREAERLGANNTKAVNSSGLDEPGQVSTAYDLALIMRESLKDPTLQEIYKQHHVDFPDKEPTEPGAERKSYRIWTENRFVLNYYEGALGGKTGFTSQAGRTFVGAMERDGKTLIVAIMRSAESTERAVNRLFEWGFANADKVSPVDQLVEPLPAEEVEARPAVNYDENGVPTGPQVAVGESLGSGPSGPVVLLILVGVAGLGVLIWRRRREVAEATRERASRQRELDLRERDESRRL